MEFLLKCRYVIYSLLRRIVYAVAYRGLFKGPLMGVGPDIIVRIRSGGRLIFGKVKSRGTGQIFCDGGSLRIGDGVFFNRGVSINCMKEIVIGDNTLLGEGVKIYDHNHKINSSNHVAHDEFIFSSVKIGEGCWLGSNTILLKGVTLSDNVTVAAGSIITKSISEPGVYVGIGGDIKRLKRGGR